jgi:hypothetical protein
MGSSRRTLAALDEAAPVKCGLFGLSLFFHLGFWIVTTLAQLMQAGLIVAFEMKKENVSNRLSWMVTNTNLTL